MNITFSKDAIVDGQKVKKGTSCQVSDRIGQKMIDRRFATLAKEKVRASKAENDVQPEDAVQEDGAE
jgi:hypothetical protein